jgi:putative ABC transport system permease protein
LRSLGASPKTIFSLLIAESQILTFSGLALGFFTTYLTLFLGAEWIENQYGLSIPVVLGYQSEFIYAAFILFVGFLTSLIPAFFAARNSVNDGLSQRML